MPGKPDAGDGEEPRLIRNVGCNTMAQACGRPKWAARASRFEIARLYRADARGMRDEDLVSEIGWAFFARIEDILTVSEAAKGRVKCPSCGAMVIRKKPKLRRDSKKEMLRCGSCQWALPWHEYFKSYRKKHLLEGGMGPFFRDFVRQWPNATDYGERIVLIDTLIHRHHWELQGDPGGPGAVNLIGGTRSELIAFLNELTYGEESTRALAERRKRWRRMIGEQRVDRQTRENRWKGYESLAAGQEECSRPPDGSGRRDAE